MNFFLLAHSIDFRPFANEILYTLSFDSYSDLICKFGAAFVHYQPQIMLPVYECVSTMHHDLKIN